MADTKDGNSNWLVSALALVVLALALLWFFSGDDEVSSSPDLGAQLTREVPRAQPAAIPPAANPVELDEKTGLVAERDQVVVAAVGESVGTPAAQTPPGQFENGLSSGEVGGAAPTAESQRGAAFYGLVEVTEPSSSELEFLARDAGPIPSEADLQRLSESEAFREPTQDEIDRMREQMAGVQEPPPEEIARMRREATIEPTEEQLERLRLQAEQYEQSTDH